jgi:hypothetical protein
MGLLRVLANFGIRITDSTLGRAIHNAERDPPAQTIFTLVK